MTKNHFLYKSIFASLVILLVTITHIISFAQDRCGTVDYNKSLNKADSPDVKEHQFENWLSNKLVKKKGYKPTFRMNSDEVVEIPIVVHIIHNGEAIGNGLNITDAQIQSQIDVLNEDFRRLNTDRINTPSAFEAVAADIQIEFVMAKQDPEGLATTAITRTLGTQNEWRVADNAELKALSYWPAEDYLNIWVTEIAHPLLGFAQFPISDELDGLEEASSNALTDGVVVDFEAFGSIDKYPDASLKPQFNKGRTTTHEIGHFLGLRHIWGDSGSSQCSTDYCEDTPPQSINTNGCPTHPASGGCGTSAKMFQNYMDYTDDQCMNLFTIDQNDRMRTVLENSPRRKSLPNSHALLPPVVYNFDLGLLNVLSPSSKSCDALITPSLLVKNYGNGTINNVTIKLSLNDVEVETIDFNLSGLTQLNTESISFSDVNLSTGDNTLNFAIISVNDGEDDNINNNTMNYEVNLPSIVEPSLYEDFEDGFDGLSILNMDGLRTWEVINAPNGASDNKAIYLDCFDYENEGAQDWLISEMMDFSSLPTASLTFDYAHAQYPEAQEKLSILISQDCGLTFQELFAKSGADLSTVGSTVSQAFTPSGASDWESIFIDLTSYIGSPFVQFAFVTKNDFGNNIYLDNINLITSEGISVALTSITSPAIVVGSTDIPVITGLKNNGSITINSLDIAYTIDGGNEIKKTLNDLNLGSGQTTTLNAGDFTSIAGDHDIMVSVSMPNGELDNEIDNTLDEKFTIDLSTDVIPLREKFEDESSWVRTSRQEVNWQEINLKDNTVQHVKSYDNEEIGGQAWLVSPTLDLSDIYQAILFFDRSYAYAANGNSETLKVLLSMDGGLDGYPIVLENLTEEDLVSHSQIDNNWLPQSDNIEHWQTTTVDLSNYIGEDSIRIAFQLTNENGNNIYLDNIEIFESNNANPLDIGTDKVRHFPSPLFSGGSTDLSLIFNLEQRQKADIRIFDLAGNQVFEQTEEYALNQTYSYDVSSIPSGMLILSVVGESFKYNTRIVIVR